MPSTPILTLPYPAGTAAANVPADVQALADRVETVLVPAGLASGQGLLWNGTAWTATDLATQAEIDAHAALRTEAAHGIDRGRGTGGANEGAGTWTTVASAPVTLATAGLILVGLESTQMYVSNTATSAQAAIQEATLAPTAVQLLSANVLSPGVARYAVPGSTSGVATRGLAGAIAFQAAVGTYTFNAQIRTSAPASGSAQVNGVTITGVAIGI